MNYSRVFHTNKRQFDRVVWREGIEVTDYWNPDKTYKIFCRRKNRNASVDGKMRLYFPMDNSLSIGTMFKLKDEIYLITNRDAVESDVFYSAIAERCDVMLTVLKDKEYVQIPFLLIRDEYDISNNNTISIVSGNAVLATQDNEFSDCVKINDNFYCFGGYYAVGNLFKNNGITHFYLERKAMPKYSLIYTGKTTLNKSEGETYQLTYKAMESGEIVESPTLTYELSGQAASVSPEGVLTLLSDGKVTLTTTWTDGDNVKCVTEITITGSSVDPETKKGTITVTGDALFDYRYSANYTAKFTDSSGAEDTTTVPVWKIEDCEFSDKIKMSPTGQKLRLTMENPEDDAYVGQTFKLTASDAEGNYTPGSISVSMYEGW